MERDRTQHFLNVENARQTSLCGQFLPHSVIDTPNRPHITDSGDEGIQGQRSAFCTSKEAKAVKFSCYQLQERERNRPAEKKAALDAFQPCLNLSDLEGPRWTKALLDRELDWHRQYDSTIPLKSHITKRDQKLASLLAAVKRYHERIEVRGLTSDGLVGERSDEVREEGGNEEEVPTSAPVADSGNASDCDSDMDWEWH